MRRFIRVLDDGHQALSLKVAMTVKKLDPNNRFRRDQEILLKNGRQYLSLLCYAPRFFDLACRLRDF